MPGQYIASIGLNVPEFNTEKTQILAGLKEIIAAAKEVNGTIVSVGNFSGGVREFNNSLQTLSKATDNLNTATNNYNKALLEQAKLQKANADAQKAQIAADNEVIKQIGLEADAEKKLAAAKDATAKAAKQKADAQQNIPFTSNLNADGSIDEPGTPVVTGTVVTEQEKAYAGATNEAYAFTEAQKQVAAETKSVDDIIVQSTGFLDEYVGTLQANLRAQIENEAAIAANKAQQKELLAAISESGSATEAQTAKLVALRDKQLQLVETNKQLSVTTRNQVKDFINVEGSTDALRARLNALIAEYDKLSVAEKQTEFGVKIKQQIDTITPAVRTAENEVQKFSRDVGNYTSGITKAFGGAFAYLRQLAYIIPGIGIAGIFNLAFEGITAVTTALLESGESFEKNIEFQKSFAEDLKNTNEVIKEQSDLIKELTQADIQYFENQLKISQASSENQEKQFVIQKQLTLAQKQQADNTVESLEASYNGQAKLTTQLQVLDDEKTKVVEGIKKADESIKNITNESITLHGAIQQSIEKAGRLSGAETVKKDLQSQLDALNAQYSAVKSQYDAAQTALQAQSNANAAVQENELKQQQYNDQQHRKLILAETEIEVGLIQDRNSRILSNDKTYYDDKIQALQSNLSAQKRLIAAQTNDVLNNPQSSSADIAIALKKQTADIYKAQQDYYKSVQKINSDIVNNTNESFVFRYNAEKKYYEASISLINNEAAHDIISTKEALKEKTDAYNLYLSVRRNLQKQEQQLLAETVEITPTEYYDNKLKQLEDYHKKGLIDEKEYQQQLNEIQSAQFDLLPADKQQEQLLARQKQVNDDLIKLIQSAGEDRIDIIAAEAAKETQILNEKYEKGLIGEKEYQNKLSQIQEKASAETLAEQIRIAESQRAQLDKFANSDQYDALTKGINEGEAALAKLGYRFDEATGKLIKFADTSKDLSGLQKNLEFAANATSALIDLTQELVTAGYERELNAIQKVEDANNTRYQTEIQNIQNSTLSEQDKAAKITELEAEQNEKQKQLDIQKRQEQTREARVAKVAQEASIIATTAQAVIAALAPPPVGLGPIFGQPVAIEAGIIGALQLAKVIATPIPQYFKGVRSSKEGFALTDEFGPELYRERSGSIFFGNDQPTLRYLQEGTEIIPNDQINDLIYKGMLRNTGAVISHKQQSNAFDYDKFAAALNKQKRAVIKPVIGKTSMNAIKNEIILQQLMNDWKYFGKA